MIMIVTFLHYAVVGHFSPALESVEFTSKESCEHARAAYLAELTPLAARLNDAIKDELKSGLRVRLIILNHSGRPLSRCGERAA